MDKINAMNTFVQIVDSGSLTKAADAMNSSLPTVVRVLASLEKSLDVRLLNRTTRRIALTDEGQHYLVRCRQIIADIYDAEQSLTAQQQQPRGKLVVTAPLLFGQLHVAPIVTQFISNYQQTQIELLLLDRAVNLIEDGVDVAIRVGHLSDSSLIAIPVGSIRQVVVASPDYLSKIGRISDPHQLKDYNCVNLTAINAFPNWSFYTNSKTIQVPITSSFQCNQALTTLDACIQGIGFGLFLSYQVQQHIKSRKLVFVLEDYEPPSIPVNIIYPHAKLLSTRVRLFVDSMVSELRQILREGEKKGASH